MIDPKLDVLVVCESVFLIFIILNSWTNPFFVKMECTSFKDFLALNSRNLILTEKELELI